MRIIWTVLFLLLAPHAAWSDAVGAPVVINGDTMRIDRAHIRLFGIDAPEDTQTCEREGLPWPCGQEAAGYLWNLVAGEYISCAERERNPAGMIVADCTLGDGRDIGEEMIEAGWALADRQHGGAVYEAAESRAKQAKRGLWAGAFTPPWEWRRANSVSR